MNTGVTGMNMNSLVLNKAYKYCRRLTIKSDTNFALGFRFLPRKKRRAIYALYAFNRFADDFVDEVRDKSKGEHLIAQWKNKLDACYSGVSNANPLLIAFSDAIKRHDIPKQPFDDAIEGFRMDLSINRYQTFDDLLGYCDKVAGTMGVMSLAVFGYTHEDAHFYGRQLSIALQLTNIIRDVGKDIKKNRIYIPLEELNHFGYSESDLKNNVINDSFRSLMRFQIGRAKSYFREANPLIRCVHPDSRLTTLLIGSVYLQILRKIERVDYDVYHHNASLTRHEKVMVFLKKLVERRYL